ncbi:MAG TPA: CehA/McbA family metallohydrolase [Polyangiaceae bacterium]|jgi:hypothetical protein
MRRARILGVTLIALALVGFLVERATRVHRRGRPAHRIARAHPHFVDNLFADHFQRGNLHTHSLRSDGTAPLEAMVAWYRSHGYQFLAMTEHDLRVDPAELAELTGPGFVVIPGEEVTDRAAGRPLHVNALCASQTVEGGRDFDRADLGLGVVLAQIRAVGGTPLVNHPNYQASLTADDIARGATGRYLLEIWSGHPDVATAGDAWRPSTEAIWDDVLAQGGDAIPAAVDDAHGLPANSGGPRRALPGQAWVETFGAETTTAAICAALAAGRLYASNGPVLASIAVQGAVFTVTTTDPAATVTFLGDDGAVLAEVHAKSATYRLTGEEGLVRARIADTAGHHAWTAAYRTGG